MTKEEALFRYQQLVSLLRRSGAVNEQFVAEESMELARDSNCDDDGRCAFLASLVAGVGFGRAPNWDEAADWLGVAAGRGHAGAREQIRFLANNESAQVFELIDFASLVSARDANIVRSSPCIGESSGFLSARECAWVIKKATPLQKAARVYDPVTGRASVRYERSNTEATFTLLDLDWPLMVIRERVANTMETPAANLELMSVFRYLAGQTFAPHFDFIDPENSSLARDLAERGQRVSTFLVYLNDAFVGGETHFIETGERLRGSVGDAIFFLNVDDSGLPDRRTLHEGTPPTSGEKWLLSQFIRNREQCPG